MKPAVWALSVFVLTGGRLLFMSSTPPEIPPAPSGLLPSEVLGYRAALPDRTYEGDGIFGYIDGAGEVYRAYNYKSVTVRLYKKKGATDITADLFDMGSSKDAFGVFTHDLEGERWPVGQDGLYKNGLLQFWRGRYFVSIFAEAETADSKAAVAELGKRITAAIGTDGPRPDLLDRLPAEFRGGGTVRYLHSPVILNYHAFLHRDNILRLDAQSEAALAVRGERAAKRYLLVARYPTAESAAQAARNFFEVLGMKPRMGHPPAAERTVRGEDGLWTAAAREAVYFVVSFKAPSEAEAASALAAALEQIRRRP